MISERFTLFNAALQTETVDENTIITVWVRTLVDNQRHLLCSLSRQHPQEILHISFASGDRIVFFIEGNGTVYLNGFTQPEEQNDDNGVDNVVNGAI